MWLALSLAQLTRADDAAAAQSNAQSAAQPPATAPNSTQQNAPQRTSINTIGLAAQGIGEDFLKKLAADNFGEYRSIQ